MAKVTSKLQVTIPKKLADKYAIRPGDEIEWVAAGDAIRVVPSGSRRTTKDRRQRLRIFDESTRRQESRQAGRKKPRPVKNRGWSREELYVRGRTG